MSLNYDQFYNWYYSVDNREELISNYILNSIKSRTEKQAQKQVEIDNLTYEKGLIVDDIIKIIKEDLANCSYNIFRYFNIDDTMWRAWRYFNLKKEKKLKELEPSEGLTETDYKNALDFIETQVKNTLIPEEYSDAKLVDFIAYNYNAEAYELTYKIKDKNNDLEFLIEIPMFNQANEKNYLTMASGYSLRQHIGCEITLEFSELDWKKFREKLKEWLDKRYVEKDEGCVH